MVLRLVISQKQEANTQHGVALTEDRILGLV